MGAPEAYRQRIRLAFGLWLDYDWRRLGWSATDPQRNYFTPAPFETALRAALLESDEYVWMYGETPRWWGQTGPEAKLPAAYADALRQGALVAAPQHLARD